MVDSTGISAGAAQQNAAVFQTLGLNTGGFGVEGLTPDSMLAYCQSRLQGIDLQIKVNFATQKKSNADSSALNELISALAACSGGGLAPNGRAASDLIRKTQETLMKVGPDSALGKKVQGFLDKLVATVDKDGHLRAEMNTGEMWTKNPGAKGDGDIHNVDKLVVQTFVDDIKGFQSDLNADMELNMIQLQSMMSQRQSAVQITTNLVQSLGEQLNKITSNIGH